MVEASSSWKDRYPQAAIAVLALDQVANPSSHAELDRQKEALETELRDTYGGFSRQELRTLPAVAPYVAYYKRFKKSYHVLQQLESIALKGKPIPRTAALVEAMFMAELKDQLLTSGHDFDRLHRPVGVTVSTGVETYVGLGSSDIQTKLGDMMITDAQGIVSSIIYGPDRRTRIRPATTSVLFTTYAPAGIQRQMLIDHMNNLKNYVRIISPRVQVLEETVIAADSGDRANSPNG